MKTLHKAIIGVLFFLSLLSVYYGAYRPFVKSQMYLRAQRAAASLDNVEGIKSEFGRMFNYASPIGDEETVKFFLEYVQSLIFNEKVPETALLELIIYAEERINEKDVIHLVQMGNAYDAFWRRTENEEYFMKAELYYKNVLALGPRLPQGLYGLFNLYGAAGMENELRDIIQRILAIWPEDRRVSEVLEALGEGS